MMSARQPLIVSRFAEGEYTNGMYVEGDLSTITILASVQPLTPEEMKTLPEARRNDAAYNLFTDTELRAAKEGSTPTNADQVTLPTGNFEVVNCAHWQNSVINHYKATVLKTIV